MRGSMQKIFGQVASILLVIGILAAPSSLQATTTEATIEAIPVPAAAPQQTASEQEPKPVRALPQTGSAVLFGGWALVGCAGVLCVVLARRQR